MRERRARNGEGEGGEAATTASSAPDATPSAKAAEREEGAAASGEEETSTAEKHRKLFRKVGQASLFTVRAASVDWKTGSINGVPLRRRKQTFCVLLWLLGMAIMPLLALAFTVVTIIATPLSPLMIAYVTWALFVDKSAQHGTRRRILSRLAVWDHIRDYFPIELVKTEAISPKRSYVFGYHPHGVISMGALINFATFATGFDKLFPGINAHVLTLAGNFRVPFQREWILWMGICDASRETCHNILSKGGGESILLAVGGAEESLDAFPGKYKLTLKNRKGFVRVALKAGASLVPVMSFGENELWQAVPNPVGSKLRNFQEAMKKLLKFTFPVIHGRGIFNYNFGLMPYRRPIHTVVGEPILIDEAFDITSDEGREKVDEVHALYITRLCEIFEKYKAEYAPGLELEIK